MTRCRKMSTRFHLGGKTYLFLFFEMHILGANGDIHTSLHSSTAYLVVVHHISRGAQNLHWMQAPKISSMYTAAGGRAACCSCAGVGVSQKGYNRGA